MEYNKDKTLLFSDFPPVLTEQWEEKVQKDLKGADYEKKLVWKTKENFNVKPYYRNEDLKDLDYLNVFPGDFPFIRGNRKKNNDWLIRQDILVKDISKANKKALDILMKGINSLGFILDEKIDYSKEDIDNLLENIYAHSIELNFICGHLSHKIIEIILYLVKKYNRNLEKITGSVDFDPLGRFSLKGNFCKSAESSFDRCKELIDLVVHLPNFKLISIHGNYFHNSGSSVIEELAFSLSMAVNYLTQLTERNLSIDKVAPRIKFNFSTGSNFFMEIAKTRAARLLWANIVKAYGQSKNEIALMNIHSTTSSWNKTIYDPYVNMLRTTTESMSSIIGGTDSMTVIPFNASYEEPTDFSERIARNQQLLLKEESHLDKVADPSAGSYYIENLTDSIAEQAWKLFLHVQEKGGYLEAFKSGFIQETIKNTAQKRDMAIANRKEIFLGTNQYPNFNENFDKEVLSSIFEQDVRKDENAIAEPIKPYRGAQAFEELRLKTEKFDRNKNRPKVFMFTYGNLSMRKARAQFACNFFACAGFELVDNPGFKTIDQGVKSCINNNSDIVVICSSDDEYAKIAPEIFDKLKGKSIVVIAGYPKDIINELKAIGIKHFIHVKSNVLESLRGFQKELGI